MACVLLADESKAIRDTLRRIFLEEGFAFCVEAANGKEAVEEAKRLRPDIVVLAYRMSEMNGLQAAYAIRQFAPATKIIFYSAVDSSEMAAAARVMGANAFVSKAAPGEILLAVRRLVHGQNPIGVRIAPLSVKPPKA
jgi:DNA-binding NarL/FixJ family response regulator